MHTGLLLGAGLIGGLLLVGQYLESFRAPTLETWRQISKGDSEYGVRDLLGEPYAEFTGESAPDDYYIPGYGRQERLITGKVLIYLGADMIMYVWIDKNGRVEHVFRGLS